MVLSDATHIQLCSDVTIPLKQRCVTVLAIIVTRAMYPSSNRDITVCRRYKSEMVGEGARLNFGGTRGKFLIRCEVWSTHRVYAPHSQSIRRSPI